MNGPLAMLIATPVAQGIPDSRATGQKDVSHHSHLSQGADAAGYRQSLAQIPALQPCTISKTLAALILRCPSMPTSGMIRWRLYRAISSQCGRGVVFYRAPGHESSVLHGLSSRCPPTATRLGAGAQPLPYLPRMRRGAQLGCLKPCRPR